MKPNIIISVYLGQRMEVLFVVHDSFGIDIWCFVEFSGDGSTKLYVSCPQSAHEKKHCETATVDHHGNIFAGMPQMHFMIDLDLLKNSRSLQR